MLGQLTTQRTANLPNFVEMFYVGFYRELCHLLMHIPAMEKRVVVHADEKLTAFVELDAAIRAGSC